MPRLAKARIRAVAIVVLPAPERGAAMIKPRRPPLTLIRIPPSFSALPRLLDQQFVDTTLLRGGSVDAFSSNRQRGFRADQLENAFEQIVGYHFHCHLTRRRVADLC